MTIYAVVAAHDIGEDYKSFWSTKEKAEAARAKMNQPARYSIWEIKVDEPEE